MIKPYSFMFFAVMNIIIFSCKYSGYQEEVIQDSTNNYITQDLENLAIPYKSHFFRNISLIKLELSDESALSGSIQTIRVDTLGNFYILDTDNTAVFCFSPSGEFRYKIQNIGYGPGEFTALYDICINKFTGNLELLQPNGKILTYSKEGQFIKENSISEDIKAVHFLEAISPDSILLFSDSEIIKLRIYDRRNQVITNLDEKVYIDLGEYMLNQPHYRSPFSWIYDTLIYFPTYTLNARYLKNGILKPYINFDFGTKNFDIDKLKDISLKGTMSDRYFRVIHSYVVNDGGFNKCGNYYFTTFAYHPTSNDYHDFFLNAITNYITGKTFLYRHFKDGTVIDVSASQGDFLYSVVPSGYLDVAVDENSSLLDEAARFLIRKASDYDNPWVIKYSIK